ncbi:MAG: HD domain-containing protein [Candidatus Altiarchaeota archaeon]|nr:HD domain-containing protein [Candidatus Altiarchaeota archaeon]
MFKKKKLIAKLKSGEFVDDIFVVKIKRELRSYKNGFKFVLILSDASGHSVEYVYWGDQNEAAVKKIYNTISEDSVIHIQATVGSYRNKLQLSANSGDRVVVLEEGEYDPLDFIQGSHRPVDEMLDELNHYIDSVKDEKLKALLKSILHHPKILLKLKKHPSAIQIHHNRIGGFLEHTLEVTKICDLFTKLYPLNHDLVITGALLHDIGKLDEMEITTRIKGTRQGQLVGHIVQGVIRVSNAMDAVVLSDELRDKLLHILVSHHGSLEYGSPKTPMFPEAIAVHLADAASAKIDEMSGFIESVQGNTEGDFVYYKRGARNLLIK